MALHIPTKINKVKLYAGLLLLSSFVTTCSANGYVTHAKRPATTIADSGQVQEIKNKIQCKAGGEVAVMFSELSVSKYLVWFAATLLLVGIVQILVGLFVFLSDALDIYMLLLNYCIAAIFCIVTILISGSGLIDPFQHTCLYLSPLNCIAISVPMMTLFLLSYSRFYAITYPFYYVDRFTVTSQLIVCMLSWLIPITVVGLGSAFLCKSISVHIERVFTGFCLYPSHDVECISHWYPRPDLDHETKVNGSFEERFQYQFGDYPLNANCQIYMMVYVVFCLIFPLLGCIVCYSIIVYQLTIIKKNREKITVSSTGNNPAEQLVTITDEMENTCRAPEPQPLRKKSISVKSLKQHLKRQTSMISQKAKDKIPVSVILILTLYIFVAVPLTMVEIFNTDMVAGKDFMLHIDLDPEGLVYLKKEEENKNWCDKAVLEDAPQDSKSLLLDISYSIGLLALGLSPWAYIKFTKSFEENLWLKPLKRVSRKIGLEIRKSVRSKQVPAKGPSTGKQANYNSYSTTTSGYASGLVNSRLSTAVAPRTSTGAAPRTSTGTAPSQRLSTDVAPCQRLSRPGAPPGSNPVSPTTIHATKPGVKSPTPAGRKVSTDPAPCQRMSRTDAPPCQRPSNISAPQGSKPVSPNAIPPTSPIAGRARRRVRGRSPLPAGQEHTQPVPKPGESRAPSESNPTDTNNSTN